MLQGLMPRAAEDGQGPRWPVDGKGKGRRYVRLGKGTGAEKETDEVIADPLPYVSTDEDAYMSHWACIFTFGCDV